MMAGFRAASAFVVLALAACGGDAIPPIPVLSLPRHVATVEITPSQATINAGQTLKLTAVASDSGGHVVAGQTVSWNVDTPTVAQIDGTGGVTGRIAGTASVTASIDGHAASATVTVVAGLPADGDIVVNPAVTHQTMVGWDAVPQIGHWECGGPLGRLYFPAILSQFQGPVLDAAADLGINRVRVEFRSGSERPDNVFADFAAGNVTFTDYRRVWYTAVNDNDDPNMIDPAGFNWGEAEFTLDKVVAPLRQRLEARGEKLYVVLNFIQFGRAPGRFQHRFLPEEYAEFMLAAFLWMQDRYGWVPDAIEIINEPDNGDYKWPPQQIAAAIVATSQRLRAAGYSPDIIAPSTLSMTNAVKYFDEMMAVPGVSNYLTDLSYHRYGGVSDAALQDIAARAKQYGVRTGMLELINAGYEDLHQDLKIGLNSEWEQYGLSGCVVYSPTSGGPHITVSQVNPTVVIYNNRTRYLMQYFKYVRRGAVRIDATSKISVLDPLAWVNTNGRFVVVVKATDAQSFSVGGLPPGRYGIFYTIGPNDETFTEANVNLPDVELGSSQALTTGIPGKGIITVYAK